jgi:hypothetical protein
LWERFFYPEVRENTMACRAWEPLEDPADLQEKPDLARICENCQFAKWPGEEVAAELAKKIICGKRSGGRIVSFMERNSCCAAFKEQEGNTDETS